MTKLILKYGDIEIDFDGPEEFLKKDLPQLIKAISELRPTPAIKKATPLTGSNGDTSGSGEGGSEGNLSVSTIAQKLSVSNGPELVIAAAFSIISAGASTFTKKQLRDRIRDAKSYYKASYANNFDNSIARLLKKGRINHTGGENYALPSTELASIKSRVSV